MSKQKGFPFIRTSEQAAAHKAYLESLNGEQKDKCPDCQGTKRVLRMGLPTVCPTCNGTGEKKLDRPETEHERIRLLLPKTGDIALVWKDRPDREKIARIICCFAEENNSCAECKENTDLEHKFPDCFSDIREHTDQIIAFFPDTKEVRACGLCGGKLSNNPHPDAGKPNDFLTVGTQYVCIPCECKNRHKWANRALEAEGQLEEAKKHRLEEHEIQHIGIALKDHYKDEWCAVCDNIARKLGFSPKEEK